MEERSEKRLGEWRSERLGDWRSELRGVLANEGLS